MPRSRKYPSAAHRQAAYRSRTYWHKEPTQKFLAGMARELHALLAEALHKGECPLPAELLGSHAGQTLQNLCNHLEYGSLEAAKKARAVPSDPLS